MTSTTKGKQAIQKGTKLYIGFTEKQIKDLETDTCKKCKHLIDDHLTGDLMTRKKKPKIEVYTCRRCGCKIT